MWPRGPSREMFSVTLWGPHSLLRRFGTQVRIWIEDEPSLGGVRNLCIVHRILLHSENSLSNSSKLSWVIFSQNSAKIRSEKLRELCEASQKSFELDGSCSGKQRSLRFISWLWREFCLWDRIEKRVPLTLNLLIDSWMTDIGCHRVKSWICYPVDNIRVTMDKPTATSFHGQ